MIDWDKVPGKVITVISDLHANKRAVKAAFDMIKQKRTDQLIILGDILTYGIDTVEVMDMVNAALDDGAWILVGNHDEIYLDLLGGGSEIFTKLRSDLQESIMYNIKKMDVKQYLNWNWKREIVHDNIYFSHANPYGDVWEYVKSQEDFEQAALKIKKMNHLAGVFGHTHRNICYSIKNGRLPIIEDLTDDTFVLNPGSVGQPRIRPLQSSLLRLSSHENRLWAEIEPIQYDMNAHVADLEQSSLSTYTKSILTSFF